MTTGRINQVAFIAVRRVSLKRGVKLELTRHDGDTHQASPFEPADTSSGETPTAGSDLCCG